VLCIFFYNFNTFLVTIVYTLPLQLNLSNSLHNLGQFHVVHWFIYFAFIWSPFHLLLLTFGSYCSLSLSLLLQMSYLAIQFMIILFLYISITFYVFIFIAIMVIVLVLSCA